MLRHSLASQTLTQGERVWSNCYSIYSCTNEIFTHPRILDVISGCYRVRVAVASELAHALMHFAVNAGGPSYLLCSLTCTEYRELKRLGAYSCGEARRVLVSLAGPEIVEHMLRDPTAILCRSGQRDHRSLSLSNPSGLALSATAASIVSIELRLLYLSHNAHALMGYYSTRAVICITPT